MKKEDGTGNCAACYKYSETTLQYFFNIFPTSVRPYNTRNANNIPQFKVKYNFLQNSFFSFIVIKWNKQDQDICNSENLNIFKEKILKFIRSSGNSIFRCHNHKGVKLLTWLRLGLNHLWEYKFKHTFPDSLNPICGCGQDSEASAHLLLHCSNYSNERLTFLNLIRILIGKFYIKMIWDSMCVLFK